MKRLLLLATIFFGISSILVAQKSKIIGVFQLIESGKYAEAKDIIEEALTKKSTQRWPKTWYAKGILCQTAYSAGIKKNDKNLFELYPDQLYVAYHCYKKAWSYDRRGRLEKKLPPRYVLLANDFMKLGEKHYKANEFEDAYRAYENALRINKSTMLSFKLDTNLLYNTTLSAFKSNNWEVATKYLTELNEYKYSSNIPVLMSSAYLLQGDTVSAQEVLIDGINNYEDKEKLVLLLVDLLYTQNQPEHAINVLNTAFSQDTSNYTYPYTIGLLYQKEEDYIKSIQSYKVALELPSDTLKIYTSIGSCYYNMGVEREEKARVISNNYRYLKMKEKSDEAFKKAVTWYEKAYRLNSYDLGIVFKLNQLYNILDQPEKLIEPGWSIDYY